MSKMSRVYNNYIPDITRIMPLGYIYNPFDKNEICECCGETFYTNDSERTCPACIEFTNYEDDYIKKAV